MSYNIKAIVLVSSEDSLIICVLVFQRPCQKKQLIDLLAEGYNPEELDGQPAVTVVDW